MMAITNFAGTIYSTSSTAGEQPSEQVEGKEPETDFAALLAASYVSTATGSQPPDLSVQNITETAATSLNMETAAASLNIAAAKNVGTDPQFNLPVVSSSGQLTTKNAESPDLTGSAALRIPLTPELKAMNIQPDKLEISPEKLPSFESVEISSPNSEPKIFNSGIISKADQTIGNTSKAAAISDPPITENFSSINSEANKSIVAAENTTPETAVKTEVQNTTSKATDNFSIINDFSGETKRRLLPATANISAQNPDEKKSISTLINQTTDQNIRQDRRNFDASSANFMSPRSLFRDLQPAPKNEAKIDAVSLSREQATVSEIPVKISTDNGPEAIKTPVATTDEISEARAEESVKPQSEATNFSVFAKTAKPDNSAANNNEKLEITSSETDVKTVPNVAVRFEARVAAAIKAIKQLEVKPESEKISVKVEPKSISDSELKPDAKTAANNPETDLPVNNLPGTASLDTKEKSFSSITAKINAALENPVSSIATKVVVAENILPDAVSPQSNAAAADETVNVSAENISSDILETSESNFRQISESNFREIDDQRIGAPKIKAATNDEKVKATDIKDTNLKYFPEKIDVAAKPPGSSTDNSNASATKNDFEKEISTPVTRWIPAVEKNADTKILAPETKKDFSSEKIEPAKIAVANNNETRKNISMAVENTGVEKVTIPSVDPHQEPVKSGDARVSSNKGEAPQAAPNESRVTVENSLNEFVEAQDAVHSESDFSRAGLLHENVDAEKSTNKNTISAESANVVAGPSTANNHTPTSATNTNDPQQIVNQTARPVIEFARTVNHRETRGMRLNLHPDELGHIEVEITRDANGRVSAVLTADRSEAAQVLANGINHLRDTLEQAGVNVDRLDVTTTSQYQNQSNNNSHNPQSSRQQFSGEADYSSANQFAADGRTAIEEDRLLSMRA